MRPYWGIGLLMVLLILPIVSFSVVRYESMNGCVPPFYWQRDSKWKAIEMGGSCSLDPDGCDTIGGCGCVLASAAMLFTYFGAPHDPLSMNECMGKYACPFGWELAGELCGQGKVAYIGHETYSQWRLRQTVLPVILGMTDKDDEHAWHFVLVVSGNGWGLDNYWVHDPWAKNGAWTRLDKLALKYDFRQIIRYAGKSHCSH